VKVFALEHNYSDLNYQTYVCLFTAGEKKVTKDFSLSLVNTHLFQLPL